MCNCFICKKKFNSLDKLNFHKNNHESFKCKCGKKFFIKSKLEEHYAFKCINLRIKKHSEIKN